MVSLHQRCRPGVLKGELTTLTGQDRLNMMISAGSSDYADFVFRRHQLRCWEINSLRGILALKRTPLAAR